MIIYSITTIKDCLNAISFRNRFDMISNDITRQILSQVKLMGAEKLNLKISSEKVTFIVEILRENTGHTEYNSYPFNVNGWTDGIAPHIKISLDQQFSDQNYTQINNSIYETIRHEIEHSVHYQQSSTNYKQVLNQLMEKKKILSEEDMLDYIKLISRYITSDEELMAYARSILYVAKKEKKDLNSVITQVFNRAFYKNDRNYILLVKDNDEAQGIIKYTKDRLLSKIREFYPKKVKIGPFV